MHVLTRDFFLFPRDGARQTGRAEAAACHNFVAEHDALPVIVAVLGEPIFFRFLPPEFSKPTDSDSWMNSTSNLSFFLSFRNAKLSRELFAKCRFRFSNVISIPVKFEVSSDLFIFSEEEEKSRIERARIPYTARIKEEKRGKKEARATTHIEIHSFAS